MNTVAAKIPSVFHRNVDAEGILTVYIYILYIYIYMYVCMCVCVRDGWGDTPYWTTVTYHMYTDTTDGTVQ